MRKQQETISEAFDLIRQYAERQGWIPIGWREFTVGPWNVTVNGTTEHRSHVPPFHAMVEHAEIVSYMLLNPFEGTMAGWQKAEDEFIAAMRRSLDGEL